MKISKLLAVSVLVISSFTVNCVGAFADGLPNKPEIEISNESGGNENIPMPYSSQYVVSTTTVSGGSWNTTWQQPTEYKYYKANYANKANCSATIYVEDKNGTVLSKKVSANKEDALYVKNAASGTHTIWIENSDGTIPLNGKLTVKSSSVSLSGN